MDFREDESLLAGPWRAVLGGEMTKDSEPKAKQKPTVGSKRPERQAAKLVQEKRQRKPRFGPDRKPRSVMFDAITREAYEHLDQAFPGGFNLTRWFNRALQAEAARHGWVPSEENKE